MHKHLQQNVLQTEVGWGWNAKTIDVLLKRKMVRH